MHRPPSAARRAALAMLVLVGCRPVQPPMTTLAPKSDLGEWTQSLYLQVIGWDTFILVLVGVLVLLALFRYSTRRTHAPGERPPPAVEHLGLEIAWTVGPALVLLAIAIPTIRTTFRTQPATPPANALEVQVTAHQWWWEVHYPSLAIVTANEIHLPLGRPVQLLLRSADVIHSFWVPQLGGKRDVVPGHTNAITLTPHVAGVYLGQCAEFCGLSHANMRFRVFVDPPDAFAAWSAAQSARPVAAAAFADARIAAGARLYATAECVTCHTVDGVSTQRVGPDLSHFATRTTFAGATLTNTPDNLSAWLRDPAALKPGAQMPALGLDREQIAPLIAYLESLR
jgi:cytochrome c oxidase subunit 2